MATTQELLAQAYEQLNIPSTATAPDVALATPEVSSTLQTTPIEQFGRTVTGGFSRVLGSALPFGVGERIIPGAASLVDALTGAPLSEAYTQRRQQLAQMEQEFGQAATDVGATIFGMPISDVAGAFAMPLPKFVQAKSIAPRMVEGVITPLTASEKTGVIGTNLLKSFGTGATIVAGDAAVDTEGDLHTKLEAAKKAVKDVAPALALGSSVSELASTVAPLAITTGEQLVRSSRGLRRGDVAGVREPSRLRQDKAASKNLIEAIDYVDNKLGKSTNRNVVESRFIAEEQKVLGAIDDALAKAKQKYPAIPPPEMTNTLKLLWEGGVSPHRVNDFLSQLGDIQSSLVRESGGDLLYYQQAKKTYGNKWEKNANDENNFYRAVYEDLREHIEKYVPEIKKLNAEEANFVVARPIIDRFVKGQDQAASGINMRRVFATTGGLGVPALLSQDEPGLAAALGIPALGLATPGGERLAGALLQRAGRAVTPGMGARLGAVTGTLNQTPSTSDIVSEQTPTSDLLRRINKLLGPSEAQAAVRPPKVETPEGIKWTKAPASVSAAISKQEPLIQAMIYQESRGNPKAKSKAGAAGLMQLMPGTAKELAVKDVFDAKQNIAAGTKYIEKMRSKFGDDSLALAAYNWGPGNVSKAVRQAAKALKKDASQVTWDDILSEVTVPTETRKYVERVFRLREQFSGQV